MKERTLTGSAKYVTPSLTVKIRRLPLNQAFYGLFFSSKCSYILLLFLLRHPNDFSHINIGYDLVVCTESRCFMKGIR